MGKIQKKGKSKVKSYISLEAAEQDDKKISSEYSEKRGVIYLSHIPHGFFEKEMREYFGQFGAVTNLHMGRSKKTGKSKGYAFIEFKYPEVAKIVSGTMNNYLMYEKLLKCELVAPEKVSPTMFRAKKVNPRKPPLRKARFAAKQRVNMGRTEQQNTRRREKQMARLRKLNAKLAKAGVPAELLSKVVTVASKEDADADYLDDVLELKEATPEAAQKKITETAKCKTPIMEVDDDDFDITLKTPPNVRKVKSRSNSTATSAVGSAVSTPRASRADAPGGKQLQLQLDIIERLKNPLANAKSAADATEAPKSGKKENTR